MHQRRGGAGAPSRLRVEPNARRRRAARNQRPRSARAGSLRYPQLLSIVVSAKENFDYAVTAIRAGAVDYISKPFDPDEFRSKVSKAISTDRFNRTLRRPHETVLAIGSHPDDVEIGCGGVLLRHSGVGHDVHLLTLTSGEAGGDAGVRAAEAERAAEVMAAELHMLDLDDTAISETAATVRVISEVIDRIRPTTIYTHSARDVHQDHRAAHNATLVAARRVPRVYAYQTPSTTVEFLPNRFISVDDVLGRKLEAIGAFESQTAIRAYLAPDLLTATARYRGRFATSRYAEPLEVVREGTSSPAAASRATARRSAARRSPSMPRLTGAARASSSRAPGPLGLLLHARASRRGPRFRLRRYRPSRARPVSGRPGSPCPAPPRR